MAELVRVEKNIRDAILTVMQYVKHETGKEPTQEEIANILNSYFILNEVGNQIRYLRKKTGEKNQPVQKKIKGPLYTLNLITGPQKNFLTKAGVFHACIVEAIQATRRFVKKTSGQEPSQDEIAQSLKSSFILSEIKNQIEFQRKRPTDIKKVDLK